MVAAKALPLLEAEAKKRQAEAGRRTQALRKGDKAALRKNAKSSERPIHSSDVAAKQFSVSGRYVKDAKAIMQESPALAAKVEAGKKTISAAKKEINKQKKKEAQEKAISLITKEARIKMEKVCDIRCCSFEE